MENVLYNISQVLGITIIHSLWQGLLVYFILKGALAFAGGVSSSKKYLFAVTCLVAITGWFVYTLVNEIHIYNWLATAPKKLSAIPLMLELPAGVKQFNDQTIRYYYSIEEYLPYISAVYLLGLLFNLARLIIGRRKINTIKQTMSIDITLQRQVNKFRDLLNIDARVKIGLTKLVDVPCMVGYFKPIILLPITLSTFLAAEEIEAILLHELAHIKRNDYLVNLLQQLIATLLFFNPCAQLINKIINEERENSCDDLVIKSTPNPVIYAKALLKLEQTRENNMRMALSATGKKYQLLHRIERIMKTKKQQQSIRPALLAMLILTLGIGSMAMLNPEIAQGKISVKAIKPIITHMLADTGKKATAKKSTKAYKAKRYSENTKADKKGREYAYSYSYSYNFDDPELDRLSKEVEKHGDAISKYYESPDFKNTQEEMEKKGQEMQAFYDNPKLKELQQKMEKLGEDFQAKYSDNSETEKLGKQMEAEGKKIETYYNSEAFKTINAQLEKKYNIPHNRDSYEYNEHNENYRNYEAELKTHIPADVTAAKENLHKMGEQMRSHFNSPGYKAKRDEMHEMGDSLRKAMHNPRMDEIKEDMHKLSAQMHAFQDNPDIRKEKEALRAASAKLREYTHTPAFEKKKEEWRKAERENRFNDDEKPEKPEKPAKPEKPEAPEKPTSDN